MAIEPTVLSDAATEPALDPAEPIEPSRSRRSVIGAGLAGLAGLVLGSLGRPTQAGAASGGSLVMGASNSAGTSNTSLTTDSTGTALLVTQTGAGTALRGSATAVSGIAGFFTSAHGPGVSGVTADNTQYGVYGANNATTTGSGAAMRASGGQNHGLVASTASAGAHAIKAVNTNTGTGFAAGPGIRVLASGGTDADFNGYWPAAGEFSGPNGVVAVANEAGGDGVYGYSGSGYGVYGQSNSDAGVFGVCESGYGVYGVNDAASFGGNAAVRAKGEQNHGLVATTSNVNAYAIKATNTNTLNSAGIRALAGGGTDADIDGLGQSHGAGEFSGPNGVVAVSGGGCGVYASSDSGDGVVATTASATSHAIRATNTNAGTGGSAGAGIRVLAGGGTDADFDGLGEAPAAGEFCGAAGVVAVAVEGDGVFGRSNSGYGVYGQSSSNFGVYGNCLSGSYGVYSDGSELVFGNLTVTGSVSKGGGSFKIDHPLDPANKFLYHSFVESPDMLNVYSGTTTLDAKGEATVTLPAWFEALNRDFRYQLTAIGQAAPDLHVKSKVQDGAFSIGGGASGQEISWLLTGIRKDAWANANRIPVEEEKPTAERGLYLHPTENGQPAAKGIEAVRIAAMRPHASK